jgi:hypothetical protein
MEGYPMKHLLIAAAALSTLAVAGAASAQSYGGWGPGPRSAPQAVPDQGRQLEWRIDRAAQSGALSWRDAQYLRTQVDYIQRLERRYAYDGISRWEASDLQRRYDGVRVRIRFDHGDHDDRGYGGWRPGAGGSGSGYGGGYGGGWR